MIIDKPDILYRTEEEKAQINNKLIEIKRIWAKYNGKPISESKDLQEAGDIDREIKHLQNKAEIAYFNEYTGKPEEVIDHIKEIISNIDLSDYAKDGKYILLKEQPFRAYGDKAEALTGAVMEDTKEIMRGSYTAFCLFLLKSIQSQIDILIYAGIDKSEMITDLISKRAEQFYYPLECDKAYIERCLREYIDDKRRFIEKISQKY